MAADLFPAGSVIRRISAEPCLVLGAARALLLQVANPAVAAGVAEHSGFQGDPFRRLRGTLEATYSVVFGSEDLAAGVGRRIQAIHDRVAGPSYRANDPANLLWVHATLLDTALGCYERYVGPLSPPEREVYYAEMKVVAEVFGCPAADQPATMAEFRDYFEATVEALEVGGTSRRLARDILWPALPHRLEVPLAPALALHRTVGVGTLPPAVRRRYGLAWGQRDERRLRRVQVAVAAGRRLPGPVRTAPVLLGGRRLRRDAARRVARFEARAA